MAHANISTIGKRGQRALADSCIGIAGLGGVGGIAFELLVRAGVGRLKIADGGFFEESNANRQSLWSRENDGVKKTAAALEFSRSAGADCRIDVFGKIAGGNAALFARGCSAVIDATDTPASRLAVYSGCKKAGVPHIFASARGGRGMLSVFSGAQLRSEPGLLFGKRGHGSCDHALGPVSNAIGCLAAQQAMNIVLSKPVVRFPSVLSMDAFLGQTIVVHEF